MINMIRLLVVAAVALTVVFACLWAYLRAGAREDLEKQWEAAGRPGPQEDYIRAGLPGRMGRLRTRLILGVYVVPLSLIALLVYTSME